VLFDRAGIIDIGSVGTLSRGAPDARLVNAGSSVILPGLINPHVHLELSGLTRPSHPDGGLSGWLGDIVSQTSTSSEELARNVASAVRMAVHECVRCGITTVGDISRQCQITRPLLQKGPLRVVSYGEVQAMGQRRSLLGKRLEVAADDTWRSSQLITGISPHAPYSVEADGYRKCLEVARSRAMPLATHLAESRDESSFLATHSGPLRELWNRIGGWDSEVPRFEGGPIRLAKIVGLLDYPTLLAHVNYVEEGELRMLAQGRCSVVYTPRTHAYFGHPPHRWREMLAAGINVAIGTDSRASAPDLNLVEELRVLHRLAPQVQAQTLWELITVRAAAALGLGGSIGLISPGKSADFAVFPVDSADPLTAVLENNCRPVQVWINAERLV
jgi:cytosine/adenosine deaminase-related metal-dependent hydrolase